MSGTATPCRGPRDPPGGLDPPDGLDRRPGLDRLDGRGWRGVEKTRTRQCRARKGGGGPQQARSDAKCEKTGRRSRRRHGSPGGRPRMIRARDDRPPDPVGPEPERTGRVADHGSPARRPGLVRARRQPVPQTNAGPPESAGGRSFPVSRAPPRRSGSSSARPRTRTGPHSPRRSRLNDLGRTRRSRRLSRCNGARATGTSAARRALRGIRSSGRSAATAARSWRPRARSADSSHGGAGCSCAAVTGS